MNSFQYIRREAYIHAKGLLIKCLIDQHCCKEKFNFGHSEDVKDLIQTIVEVLHELIEVHNFSLKKIQQFFFLIGARIREQV